MRFSIIAILLLALVATSFAEDYVAVNSNDGRDVLSGIFYANVKGLPVKFMPVPGGDADIFAAKIGSGHDILLIQGSVPVSTFVEPSLRNRNNTVEVYTSPEGGATNLELAKRSGAAGFIIVDSVFSDSALSVLPYAAKTKSYVLLADKNNIEQVKEIVKGKKITIFGLVDREVKDQLAEFNPQVMGKGEDKFEDNVEIAQKTMSEFGIDRIVIVDGSFIEEGMTSGDQPIVLSGRIVPQTTYDFLKRNVRQDKLTQVMLIGNELIVPIYDMRERMEKEFASEGLNKSFGIIVKFAQVVPAAGSGVLTLDTFRLPAYKPSIKIHEVVHNSQSGKVMVSLNNTGEGAAYYTTEVRIKVNGEDLQVFGDEDAKLIERGEIAALEHPLDLSNVAEGNVTALVLVKYGGSKKSLEEFTSYEGPLTTISYADKSDVEVQLARYDSEKKSMLVTIRNTGEGTAYVFSRLGVMIGGVPTNISSPSARAIEKGSIIVEEFPIEFSDKDLRENKNVTVFVDYGGRVGFLLKRGQFNVQLEEPEGLPIMLILAGIVILAVLTAAVYLFVARKKRKYS